MIDRSNAKTYATCELRRYVPAKIRPAVKEIRFLGTLLGQNMRLFKQYQVTLNDGYCFGRKVLITDNCGFCTAFPSKNGKVVVVNSLNQVRNVLKTYVVKGGATEC